MKPGQFGELTKRSFDDWIPTKHKGKSYKFKNTKAAMGIMSDSSISTDEKHMRMLKKKLMVRGK